MGLAASQARLLTITARKADCEFESMALSHQKLALARDMERISTEYQNAINKTKLVYDYYGSADKQLDLTYDLLMNPSIYNDYVPRLLTDPKNRVILDSRYAAAARAAGIPAEGLLGAPSTDIRDKFVDALLEGGIITANQATAIKKVPYNNAVGFGNDMTSTVSYKELTYDELMEEITKNIAQNSMSGAGMEKLVNSTDTGKLFDLGLDGLGWPVRVGQTAADGSTTISAEGAPDGLKKLNDLTLVELLNGNTQYFLAARSAQAEMTPISVIAAFQNGLIGAGENDTSFLNWLTDAFASVLGGIPDNDAALQYAYNAVYDIIHPTNNVEAWIEQDRDKMKQEDKYDRCEWFDDRRKDGKIATVLAGAGTLLPGSNSNNDKFIDNYAIASNSYIGTLYTQEIDGSGLHADRKERSQAAINLNNLAKVFLTAYVQYQQGVENSEYHWDVGLLTDSYLYNGKRDKDFTFIVSEGIEIEDGTSKLYAQFYDALFNRICLNGWTENDNVNDKEYMQELIKGGMAFISTMSDDGFYYQGNYATDRTILEVVDDEAVARAQAKYNREKASIEYKEDRIDLKMKNLDTEISSLTTEYDTTKQLITKTVEKSFKRYEA